MRVGLNGVRSVRVAGWAAQNVWRGRQTRGAPRCGWGCYEANRGTDNAAPADHLSQQEISRLRDLANGVSVGRIAEDTGYSERRMFRLLRDLLTRLGTRNRTEAPMLATQRGWT